LSGERRNAKKSAKQEKPAIEKQRERGKKVKFFCFFFFFFFFDRCFVASYDEEAKETVTKSRKPNKKTVGLVTISFLCFSCFLWFCDGFFQLQVSEASSSGRCSR
jgi:hypothetical protein